jgi:antitoxin component YwqK of YwqJK toxin-antitoxin module
VCDLKMKNLVIIGILFLMVLSGTFLIKMNFYNSFLGPCDGHGPENGERTYYYDNGNPHKVGIVKNCSWNGKVTTYFKSGEIQSLSNFKEGQRHGLTEYFTRDSIKWRQENFSNGNLQSFALTDLSDNSTFTFSSNVLSLTGSRDTTVLFNEPLTMSGYDEPFTSLHGDKLLLRGRHDFYIVNKKLEIELNLRDTLMKYIPTAYKEKTDQSGNKYTFLWHRRISGDTLNVKVFYDGDKMQSNHKTWERKYQIKRKTTHNNGEHAGPL